VAAGSSTAGASVAADLHAASNMLKATNKLTTIYNFFISKSPPKIFV
jgi:hypothetical protein